MKILRYPNGYETNVSDNMAEAQVARIWNDKKIKVVIINLESNVSTIADNNVSLMIDAVEKVENDTAPVVTSTDSTASKLVEKPKRKYTKKR